MFSNNYFFLFIFFSFFLWRSIQDTNPTTLLRIKRDEVERGKHNAAKICSSIFILIILYQIIQVGSMEEKKPFHDHENEIVKDCTLPFTSLCLETLFLNHYSNNARHINMANTVWTSEIIFREFSKPKTFQRINQLMQARCYVVAVSDMHSRW